VANRLQSNFDPIILTQDWHPSAHKSFASQHNKQPGEIIVLNGLQQILWPDHCVQGEIGAEFAPGLQIEKVDRTFKKGTDLEIDSYSGFFDNDQRKSTGLGDYLKDKEVKKVFIAGLALDYCVKYTALDAQRLGFDTCVVLDATRAVNVNQGDGDKAVEEMKQSGIKVIKSSDIL